MFDSRKWLIQVVIVLSMIVFMVRLLYLQVFDENYKLKAESNIVQKIVEEPYRGLIFDRNGKLMVYNEPIYTLKVIPKEVKNLDTNYFINVLDIEKDYFLEKMNEAKSYSFIKPYDFLEKLNSKEFARIQDHLVKFRGFYISATTKRAYTYPVLSNSLGYLAEISKNQLEKDSTNYYKQGDLIGISGIESEYQHVLRGQRGFEYKIVNAQGVPKGQFKDGEYDQRSEPGKQITLSIDLALQRYAEKLMQDKIGSIVAIEPSTGEVLCLVSAPSYNPGKLSGRHFSKNFSELKQDTLTPLFNRPLMAVYPPGSMFKTVQSLIGLQENVVSPEEQIYNRHQFIGDLAPPGYYNIQKAIKYSSNNYFYQLFKRIIQQKEHENAFIDARIGFEKWRDYVYQFGLGNKLGIDLPNEKGGFIPDLKYYDRFYGKNRWQFSNIYSLSIGQGEILVTPIQMANLGCILGNSGFYYTPHVVKKVGNDPVTYQKHTVNIDSNNFNTVIKGMRKVVKEWSGTRANLPDIKVCGKTSTVENPHGEDHSGFMGFAPMKDAEIAVAVYVENAGFGSRAAASIAGLVIEKYLKGDISRKWAEEYALKGEFIY